MKNNKNKAGLIWVTGFSSSGKTTISREVNLLLKKSGYSTIFLDGDDLRKIFGNTWGYDRKNREELAQIYLRLCSHLASQDHTVIISAIAMFSPLFKWVKENFENSMQVYLKVPSEIRLQRDKLTKRIYINNQLNDDFYDIPQDPDLIIENFGNQDPFSAAKEIVEKFSSQKSKKVDTQASNHWEEYYKMKDNAPTFPSPFAEYVANKFNKNINLLEIGCGNGRDAKYFASMGHKVTAIDRSVAAIKSCNEQFGKDNIKFYAGTISSIKQIDVKDFDLIYSRFVLHAMSLNEEIQTLKSSHDLLKKGGILCIECRSVNDPLYRKGDIISHTERIDGHYRRFIILEEIKERLNYSGFKILIEQEDKGLAKFGNDDPVVIRLEAVKK